MLGQQQYISLVPRRCPRPWHRARGRPGERRAVQPRNGELARRHPADHHAGPAAGVRERGRAGQCLPYQPGRRLGDALTHQGRRVLRKACAGSVLSTGIPLSGHACSRSACNFMERLHTSLDAVCAGSAAVCTPIVMAGLGLLRPAQTGAIWVFLRASTASDEYPKHGLPHATAGGGIAGQVLLLHRWWRRGTMGPTRAARVRTCRTVLTPGWAAWRRWCVSCSRRATRWPTNASRGSTCCRQPRPQPWCPGSWAAPFPTRPPRRCARTAHSMPYKGMPPRAAMTRNTQAAAAFGELSIYALSCLLDVVRLCIASCQEFCARRVPVGRLYTLLLFHYHVP